MEAVAGRARWTWGLLLLVCVALAFFARAAWYLGGELEPAFTHAGYPSLTSVDGYHFAAGVGAATSDAWGESARVAEPGRHALVSIGAALVELGVAREAVFTWLPPLLGALVVLPVFALGWFAGGRWVALLAGLGAAFAPAHVGRTTVGYFDTDVFSVSVPLGVAAFLVAALRAPSDRPPRALCLGALLLALYPFTYDQGGPLGLAMVVAFAVVAWVGPWLGTARTPWRGQGLLVLVAAVLPVPVPFAVLAVVLVFGGFWMLSRSKPGDEAGGTVVPGPAAVKVVRARRLEGAAWVALVAVVALSPATASLSRKAAIYGGAGQAEVESVAVEIDASEALGDWAEVDTTPSVAEARTLPSEVMFARAAGHALPFVLGLLGLVLMVFAFPNSGVIAPVVAVGLFAFSGGHRFLLYLAPVVSIGMAWLAVRAFAMLPARVSSKTWLSVFGAVCFAPAVLATLATRPRPVMVAGEVAELERMGARAGRAATTIAWWDYGYPIVYHARTRVVADGARRGAEASLVAEMLMTHDDELARRLAFLAAGAEVSAPEAVGARTIDRARAEGLEPERWLDEVAKGRWPPEGLDTDREVFLYLPLRMMPIIPTVAHYRVGARAPAGLRRYLGVRPEGRRLLLREDLEVDADSVTMRRREPSGEWQVKSLHSIHSVSGSGDRRAVRKKSGAADARTAGVFLVDLALFIELDVDLLESVWARLFLFEAPSPAFELVSSTAGAKVYRVSRPRR